MSRRDALTASFCGLSSSPEALARLVATAPAELLAELQSRALSSRLKFACGVCIAGHLPLLAGLPIAALPLLPALRLPEVLPQGPRFFVAPHAVFRARGPPRGWY